MTILGQRVRICCRSLQGKRIYLSLFSIVWRTCCPTVRYPAGSHSLWNRINIEIYETSCTTGPPAASIHCRWPLIEKEYAYARYPMRSQDLFSPQQCITKLHKIFDTPTDCYVFFQPQSRRIRERFSALRLLSHDDLTGAHSHWPSSEISLLNSQSMLSQFSYGPESIQRQIVPAIHPTRTWHCIPNLFALALHVLKRYTSFERVTDTFYTFLFLLQALHAVVYNEIS